MSRHRYQQKRGVLIKLYESTNGANLLDNSGWLGTTGTECTWKGVSCSQNSVSTIQLVSSRPFNPKRASKSDYTLPDCSAKVETTSLNYSDYILLDG